MIRVLAGLSLACVLSGCASSPDLAKVALGNLEHCERTYVAVLGGLGTNGGSLNIRCPAKPYPEP